MSKRRDIAKKLSSEEREFLQQLLTKEKSAITRVIKKSLGEMYDELNDDCLSDIYWLLMRKVGELMTYRHPEQWLVISAKLISLNIRRGHNKALKYISDMDVNCISLSDDIFELAMYDIWMEQDVYNLLKKELTERELQLFELMFEQEKTNKEISDIMGIEEATVRNIKKSIKDKYRDAIKNKY